jgi:superfamily I DNA and RNA helicase
VLIISFNITLWHYIRDMIARAPFNFSWANITFNHFHGFCRDRLHEFDRKWPNGPEQSDYRSHEEYVAAREEFFRSVVPSAVSEAIESRKSRYQRYDAILIDEGQDYYVEWYELLDQYFLTSRDELLVLCDKKQNIYERELDWLDKRITRRGLDKFKDPYIDLTVTFRLPRKVAVMTNDFSVRFNLNQELKVGKFEEQPTLVHSQHIVWRNIQEEEWLENCHFAFLRLRKAGYSASDMVILLPNHEKGLEAVRFFEKQALQVNHVFEDGVGKTHHHKKSFWMGDSRLKLSTIHSFKGWELINIVLYIPATVTESIVQLDAMVYTALTRTRENLIVLNANPRYREFGEQFPKAWDDQNAYAG